ncbi:hypothetical protein GLYMA_07G206701v4 [Glycine max]|nr:hypothetical protein GLYMA_07G206701v4 [Glycine max]KAH1087799.1 hypothetical protein GYH30_019062 [Glycine max]
MIFLFLLMLQEFYPCLSTLHMIMMRFYGSSVRMTPSRLNQLTIMPWII